MFEDITTKDFAKWVKEQVTRENCFANKVLKYVDLDLQNNND